MSRKHQRKWLNITLAVALIVLVAGVWFSQKKPEPVIPLTKLKPALVNHISINHPDKPVIELARRKDGWWLTKPVEIPASKFQVNALLELSNLTVKSKYKVSELKLKDVGLQPPSYSITLNQTKLEFGGTEPINYRRYIKVGDTVNLVPDPPSSALDSDYSDLVNSAPVPPGQSLTEIELPHFKLVHDQKTGGWDTLPKSAGKGSDAAQALVDAWQNARAMWQKMPGKKDQPIKDDYAILTLAGKPVRFEVVEKKPQLKLLRPDIHIVYTLSGALSKDMFELKAPKTKQTSDKKATGDKKTSAAPDIVGKAVNSIEAKDAPKSEDKRGDK